MNLCTSSRASSTTTTPTASYSLSTKTILGSVGAVAAVLFGYGGWSLYTSHASRNAQLRSTQQALEEAKQQISDLKDALNEKTQHTGTISFAAKNLLSNLPGGGENGDEI